METVSRPEVWAQVAKDVGPGWMVSFFHGDLGEVRADIHGKAELRHGLLRLPIRIRQGRFDVTDVIEAPTAQRTVRFMDSNVLISGVGTAWLLSPSRTK